jgi:hypothetical protein
MKLVRSNQSKDAVAAVATPQQRAVSPDRPTFSSHLLLPMDWQLLREPPSRGTLDMLERTNAAVLDTLLKGVDLDAARVEDEELAEALKPLRVKIDMIVEMLARLSYRDRPLPEPREIEISLSRIVWSAAEFFGRDQWLLMRLYFHSSFREPISLAGHVVSCDPDESGTGRRVAVELAEMAEGIGESFARLIFLEHRRHLAQHPDQLAVSRRQI